MYHVLIVDDHLDQRDFLRFLLNKRPDSWQISEAANGKEALAILNEKPIDLMITDVKMPFLSGIELAEGIRKQNNQMPILFISGYDDFKYAKRALDLEAINYLLKPINPIEFNEQLDKLLLFFSRTSNSKKQKIKRIQQDSLIQLFRGIPFDELNKCEKTIVEPIVTQTNYLLTIDVNHSDAAKVDYYLAHLSIHDLLFVRTNLSRFVGLSQTTYLHEVLAQKQRLKQSILTELHVEIVVEVSTKISCHDDIYLLYQNLDHQIRKNFYNVPTNLLTYPINDTTVLTSEQNMLKEMQDALNRQDLSEIKRLIQFSYHRYGQSATESPSMVKFFFATVYQLLATSSLIDQMVTSTGIKRIIEATVFSELQVPLEELLTLLEEQSRFLVYTQNEYVRKTKQFILNHYTSDLNLDILAANVHLAPKYLSDLFKREESIGISKFITDTRIDRAKELLIESTHRIREISEMVGFNSHSYFIKTFQKKTGVTPDRFRKLKGHITDGH